MNHPHFSVCWLSNSNFMGENMKQLYKLKAFLVGLLTVGLVVANTAGVAMAAGPSLKPTPTRPTTRSSIVAAPISTKPATIISGGGGGGWTVSLSASSTNLWPQQYSTLTATANADVGPTPYYISIYDQTAGSYLAICGSGTSCASSVTQPTAATHTFIAYVSGYPTSYPPAGIVATSPTVTVTWRSVSITLAVSPTTQVIGGGVALTSTTSADIGPSPFYAEIYDATTGTRLQYCGFGTSCSVTATQAVATTHKFVAYVSNYSTTNPPAGIQATSNPGFATWANTGYRLSLSASRTAYGQDTLTATSNINVGPTPYYIEIFNLNTNTRVAVCGSGTTCSAVVSLGFGQNRFVAFTSSYDTAIPPLNTQASSNVVSDFFFPIFTAPTATTKING